MTIKTKLRLAFGTLMILFVAFGVGVIQMLSAVSADSDLVARDVLLGIQATYAIDVATGDYRGAEMMHVLSGDDAGRVEQEEAMARLKTTVAEWRHRYEPLVDTPDERRHYDAFSRNYAAYLTASDRLIELSRRGETAAAAAMAKETAGLFRTFSRDLEELVHLAAAYAADANRNSANLIGGGRLLILGGMALVLLFGGACLWAVDRGIGQPVAAMTGTLTQLAAGDFSLIDAGTERTDDLGRMARAVEATGGAMRALSADLGELVDGAHAGALSTRAEPTRHTGEYAVLVKGMNDLIEGLTRPLFEVVDVMQLLAAGNLRGRMEGSYEGDLRALKANLNRSLEALVSLLNELGGVTAALARGDLTRSVGGSYLGDFAVLKGHINQAIEQLRTLIATVAEDTQQIAAAITQTSAAARQVAEESARAQGTLDDVAAGIGETAASVDSVAAAAVRGSELAGRSSTFADEGRERLVRLTGSVERIAATHGRIEQITGRITRIADKTHILSLNAGIEATRAGETGAGFAIVAHQIGRLAEEAAAAANDIGQIIADSTLVVREGVGTAAEARTAIERIAEAAHDSGATVQAISAAIAQQSAAVKDLHGRVWALRQGNQANAAAAEEISVTMEELARMVHRARDRAGRFILTAAAPAPAPAPAPAEPGAS